MLSQTYLRFLFAFVLVTSVVSHPSGHTSPASDSAAAKDMSYTTQDSAKDLPEDTYQTPNVDKVQEGVKNMPYNDTPVVAVVAKDLGKDSKNKPEEPTGTIGPHENSDNIPHDFSPPAPPKDLIKPDCEKPLTAGGKNGSQTYTDGVDASGNACNCASAPVVPIPKGPEPIAPGKPKAGVPEKPIEKTPTLASPKVNGESHMNGTESNYSPPHPEADIKSPTSNYLTKNSSADSPVAEESSPTGNDTGYTSGASNPTVAVEEPKEASASNLHLAGSVTPLVILAGLSTLFA